MGVEVLINLQKRSNLPVSMKSSGRPGYQRRYRPTLGKVFRLARTVLGQLQNDYDLRLAEASGIGRELSRARFHMKRSLRTSFREADVLERYAGRTTSISRAWIASRIAFYPEFQNLMFCIPLYSDLQCNLPGNSRHLI